MPKRPGMCSLCGNRLHGSAEVRHIEGVHESDLYETVDCQWKCHPCRVGFQTEAQLYNHLNKMTNPRTHITPIRNSLDPSTLFRTPLRTPESIVTIWRTSSLGRSCNEMPARDAEVRTIVENLLSTCGHEGTIEIDVVGGAAQSNTMPHARNENTEESLRRDGDS